MVLRDLNARTFGKWDAQPRRQPPVPAILRPSPGLEPRLSALEAGSEDLADLPDTSFSARTRSSQASGTVSRDTSAVSLRAAGDEVLRCAPASPPPFRQRDYTTACRADSATAVMDVSTPREGWVF